MSANESEIRFMFDVAVPMRDGVRLSADIYLPAEEGRYPAIVQRTPYDNTSPAWVIIAEHMARHGYAFVSQDVRGRCDSEGKWVPYMNEMEDGYDTVEWVAQQPWCTGKVGMMGGSYGGAVQWWAARERPPHLTALVSTSAGPRRMQGFPYMNGKIQPYAMWVLHLVGGRTMQEPLPVLGGQMPRPLLNWKKLLYHRPLKTLDEAVGRTNTVWKDWLAHPTYDSYWRKLSLDGHFEQIDLPVLHITGWYDGAQWGELYMYGQMVAHSPAADKQFLLCGPWSHDGTRTPVAKLGGVEFSEGAVVDINSIHLRWFDHWLKGEDNGQENDPRVRIYVMGRDEWREEPAWPLPDTRMTSYYFHSRGQANTLAGDGLLGREVPANEPTDSYIYDPDNPTPSSTNLESFPHGDYPLDERYIQLRDDVLVYTTPPLTEELEVTGTPFVVIHAVSDALDTDFAAVLSDVYPDGRSVRLAEGILRASYRDSLEKPALLTPGWVYQYKIELNATSMAFQPGHRIRVSIMSCRFPAWDRNPNTGAPIGEDSDVRLARQTVYHDSTYPSHVLLPVIPSRG